MRKGFWRWIYLLLFVFLTGYSVHGQLISHSYRFYNNLSVSPPECGPDLVPTQVAGNCSNAGATGGSFIQDTLPYCGVRRTLYRNNLHWGLQYPNTAGTITTTYTIYIYLKNTNWGNTWTRIIDFSNGTSDAGIYYKSATGSPDRCLEFFPNGIVGACPFFNDTTYYLLTFTRNSATNIIDVYVNNILFTSYNDAAGRYAGTAGTPIYIYRDDQVVSCESGIANFAYLSFTNRYSNQTTVDSVYNEICSIANAPSADFSYSPSPACNFPEDITVTYTGSIAPPGTGYTFNWNWDGGTVVSGSGMGPYIIRWPTAGSKQVSLTITNTSCGTQTTETKTINLYAPKTATINQVICQGQSYQGYTATGTYTDVFSTPGGCDSTRILNLTVTPPITTTINQTICQGQSYQGYSATGTYTNTFQTGAGCDSTRILNLTVTPAITTTVNQSICQGQSYQGYSATGTYTNTFQTGGGCDSIRTLHLVVNPVAITNMSQAICQGQSYQGYSSAGVYRDTFTGSNSCDSIRILNLTVLNNPNPGLGPDRVFCRGEVVVLNPGNFTTYLWQDGSTQNSFTATQPGLYTVTVTDNCGLKSDQVMLTENPCNIEFPTGFTPNGDGINDRFGILNGLNLQAYQLSIYNRWGQRIFYSTNPAIGWNGVFNGKLQNPGVYTWTCTYTKANQQQSRKGTVILIR